LQILNKILEKQSSQNLQNFMVIEPLHRQ